MVHTDNRGSVNMLSADYRVGLSQCPKQQKKEDITALLSQFVDFYALETLHFGEEEVAFYLGSFVSVGAMHGISFNRLGK